MSEWVKVTASDGNELSVYVARPQGEPIGAIVVVQEIFGVNKSIQAVADSYAKDGFLAVAPAIFDRIEPGRESRLRRGRHEEGLLALPQTQPRRLPQGHRRRLQLRARESSTPSASSASAMAASSAGSPQPAAPTSPSSPPAPSATTPAASESSPQKSRPAP